MRATLRRCVAGWLLAAGAVSAFGAGPVQLEQLTWTEVRDRLAAGATTVLVPIGGTEQSGPHLALGKHNVRVKVLSERIALQLGDALVAPVLAYVPEGRVAPPTAHMRWPGTISVEEPTFEAIVAQAARSLRQHGFRTVVLLADHGDTQKNIRQVAEKLNREWGAQARALALVEYYRVAQTEHPDALRARGFSAAEIGRHAGLADTALALAVDPSLVRADAMAAAPKPGDGTDGDPRRATAELGRIGTERIVAVSVAAIRAQRLH
jgi:creatinine amidohydrolase